MQDPLNVGDLFKHSPLFLDFDDDDIALLTCDSRVVRVLRHDFAFHRGDHAGGFYVVVIGVIRPVLPGAHGQCRVIEFLGPGECFGEPFMFLSRPCAADTRAMEGSLPVWIGKHAVDDALHMHPRLTQQMLAGLSTRLRTLMYDTGTVNLQSANERLIRYLLLLPRKFDRTRFPYNENLVASKLELAPATLFRTLRQLVRNGLIRMEGHRVVIQNTTMSQRRLVAGQRQKLDAGQSPAVSGRYLNVLMASSTNTATALNSSSL